MKKSTKIILIASGTVILVSVILIIVLALTMQAQQLQTPPPESGLPSGYTCSQSQYTRDGQSGLKLTMDWGEPEPAAGVDRFRSKITWSYTEGVEQFLQKVRNEGDREMYTAYIQIKKVVGGDIVERLNAANLFEPKSKTFYFDIDPGKEIDYSALLVVCWQEGDLIHRDYDYRGEQVISHKSFKVKRPADGGNPTIENPTQESISRVVIPGKGECDCPGKYIDPLGYIVCEVVCGILDFLAQIFNWALGLMKQWSGL